MNSLKTHFSIKPEVDVALSKELPVLALESTIVAHGMPYPDNLHFARMAENTVRKSGVTPATIAIIDGKIHIGLDDKNLEALATNKNVEKIAVRDIAYAITHKLAGATTVSATMHIAHLVGIEVFATGGIGGVHRNSEASFDISQDLTELSQTPMIVVSAGAKAILDIAKTLEYLETNSVPIVGYKTNTFPAFFSRSSGYKVAHRCNNPTEIAKLFKTHRDLGLKSTILVANPVPKADEIPKTVIQKYIDLALVNCAQRGITGKKVTPFLLKNIAVLSCGKSLKTNIALALNNVRLATEIAKAL